MDIMDLTACDYIEIDSTLKQIGDNEIIKAIQEIAKIKKKPEINSLGFR